MIHDAIRDLNQWEEAITKVTRKMGKKGERRDKHMNIKRQAYEYEYYCLVDASWKNGKEVAGVGWSLHSIQGSQQLQGSSSIRPTNTPREAEAEALRMAVRQLRELAYKNVHFKSDC